MNKKIFILLGHSDKDTSSARFANAYQKGAEGTDNIIKRVDLCDVKFDPVLHKGYRKIQELEPGLVMIQENIKWCDHMVIIYPMWWGTMPAILKGMFDRLMLPGFAFRFDKITHKPEGLLKNKSAHLVMLCGAQTPWKVRLLWGNCMNEIKHAALRFCGIKPVRTTMFGPVEFVSQSTIEKWYRKMTDYGSKTL